MKVLHILNELKPSGAEVMLLSAGFQMKEYGISGEILSTGLQIGSYAERLASAGYIIHHIPFTKSPSFFLKLFRFLNANSYDVVHLHTEGANFWKGIVALLTTKRCIRTVHNNFPFTGYLCWRRKWQRQLLSWLGLTHISISKSVHDTEYSHYGLETRIIPNWYDSMRFTKTDLVQYTTARKKFKIPDHNFVLVSIGNCSPIKNHSVLIKALARHKHSNLLYLHIGIEPDKTEQELAEKLGIRHLIRFEGMQSEVLNYLQAADLFVMPSTHEGFSIAALEAIATGLPSLLTDVNGLADLADFFKGIHYCQPNTESISAALTKIIEIPIDELRNLASENPEKAEQLFGITRGLSNYVNVYQNY